MIVALFFLLLSFFILILNIGAAINKRLRKPPTVVEPRRTRSERTNMHALSKQSANLAHANIAVASAETTLRPFRRPLFIDCETTGLHSTDGIITLAMISLNLDDGSICCNHFIFDPLCKSHPAAEAVHEIDDWTIRHQPLFGEHLKEIDSIIRNADGIVCHNAKFDMSFLLRSYEKYGVSLPDLPVDCTMVEARYRGESASLTRCAARIGLKRSGNTHGAMEDAVMCLRIWLNYRNIQFGNLPGKPYQSFSNYRDVPERPEVLPRRGNKAKWKRYCASREQDERILEGQ